MKQRTHHIIYLVVFLDLLGFGLIIPQLGVYAKLYHASGAMQGMLIASYSLFQFVASPLLGRWSDRVGRRPVLIVSLTATLLGYVLFALSRDLTLLFLSRIVAGSGGGNVATAQAYLTDTTPPEKRAAAMGMIGAAFGLGFVLGPAMGAFIGPWGMGHWGPHGGSMAIGGLAAVLSLCTLAVAVFRLPESLPAERRSEHPGMPKLIDFSAVRHAVERPALGRLLLIFLVSTTGFAVLHAIMTFFVIDSLGLHVDNNLNTERASRLTGEVFAWIGFVAVMVQGGMVRPLVKRYGEAPLLVWGLGLMALALFLLPEAHSLGALMLYSTPLAIGNALCTANQSALLTFHSPARQRGEVLGVNQSLGSIGRILGPLLGGALYDVGHPLPFWAGAALCAVATVIALGVPRDRPVEDEAVGLTADDREPGLPAEAMG